MDSAHLGNGPCRDVTLLKGGTQNVLARFRRGEDFYVLRCPPKHPLSDGSKTMLREARLLRALAGTAVPHPTFYAECTDRNVIGECFYLMESVEGFNPTAGLPVEYASDVSLQRAMAFSAIDAILALGKVDYLAVGLGDFGKLNGYLDRQVVRWQSQLEGYSRYRDWPGSDGLPEVQLIREWLERCRPESFSPGIVHGDFHLANTIFRTDSPRLAAIVDWELATIGDPMLDFAWLLATWPDINGRDTGSSIAIPGATALPTTEDLIDRYDSGSDRALSGLQWNCVLACYKLGILLEGTYARACDGKADMNLGLAQHNRAVAMLKRGCSFIASTGLGSPAITPS
jgi:aminoglycoside phosphotransferase (APT) family kinase protein